MNIVLVAIGYNRPYSLLRLLKSLENANYEGDKVTLVISLDKSDIQNELFNMIKPFIWSHGEKQIICRKEKMGLKRHVITCGDLVANYDALIMFEDDIVASPFFYTYVKQTLEIYSEKSEIAGISLYKHETHPGTFRPFHPYDDGNDVFFMQFAQSWGQCWTKQMWLDFKEWFNSNEYVDLASDTLLPYYITCWNEQSWLKYYMRYLVLTNKYFVYPVQSLTTNASDAGEHNVKSNNDFQVPLLMGIVDYKLPKIEDAVCYDVYFERMRFEGMIFPELKGKKVLDLYGNRRDYLDADFIISSSCLPFKIIRRVQMKYRPMELNLIYPEEGNGIYIYDRHKRAETIKISKNIITRYDVRATPWKRMIELSIEEMKGAISLKLRRFFRRK